MKKKVHEQRRRYKESIPGAGKAAYGKKYDKAMSGRDPRAAIAAKCLDCMHWQRGRITECPIVCCPLWPYRPFTSEAMRRPPVTPKKRKKPTGSPRPRKARDPKRSAKRRPSRRTSGPQ